MSDERLDTAAGTHARCAPFPPAPLPLPPLPVFPRRAPAGRWLSLPPQSSFRLSQMITRDPCCSRRATHAAIVMATPSVPALSVQLVAVALLSLIAFTPTGEERTERLRRIRPAGAWWTPTTPLGAGVACVCVYVRGVVCECV